MLKIWFSFLLSIFLTLPVLAQEESESETTTTVEEAASEEADQAEQQQMESPSAAGVEKIEVTGSHIKRVDVEGPSPVVTFDREYLDRSGYNSVADVLRDTTVAGLGAGRESGLTGGASTGAATTSVRGMGSDSVLILMDGRRLPTIGGSTTVDLNLIPMAAIERVEVLKDGASALYGSDALGGVINFITKKDFDGANISLTHNQPEKAGGARSDITGTYGKSGSNYNFLGVLQYRNNNPVGMRQRDFFIPTPAYFSGTGSPGSWKNHDAAESAWNTNLNSGDPCPDKDARGRCRFDYSPYMNVIPKLEQFSTLLRGSYKINEELEAFGRAIVTRRVATSQLAPPPDSFADARTTGGLDTRIPKATADAWGIPAGSTTANGTAGESGKDVDVLYRLVEEVGPRINEVTSDNVGVTSGVKGYIGDTWDWEVSGNYAQSNTINEGVSGYADKILLRNAAIANPAAFNPFATSGAKANIDFAKYTPRRDIFSNIGGVLAKGTGEVFSMPAGPVALAVGVSANWQTYEESTDVITSAGRQWGGGTKAEGYGRRDFQSAYAEFAFPLLKNLEAQLAGRFDNFSDFGSTVNPKLGLRYKPWQALMLRGSWGTGFKAPALSDLYGAQSIGYPFGVDPIANEANQYETLLGGNPNLKEETSQSFNVGFIYQVLDSLSVGADYYINNQDNVVSAGTLRDLFRAEQAGININSFGFIVERQPAGTGSIQRIVQPTVNLARRETEGMEFRVDYAMPVFGNWRFTSLLDYSLIFSLKELPFPGLPMEERAGFAGRPRWRSNLALGMTNGKWGINSLIRGIAEQNFSVNSPTPGVGGRTRDHYEWDLQSQYAFDWKGTVAVGIRNVLNTDRPLQEEHLANGFLNTSLYDPFGRTVFLNYSQDF